METAGNTCEDSVHWVCQGVVQSLSVIQFSFWTLLDGGTLGNSSHLIYWGTHRRQLGSSVIKDSPPVDRPSI